MPEGWSGKHEHKAKGNDKAIQDLKTEFNKTIEALKRIQPEMNTEMKSPITQVENSRESLISWMKQAEARDQDLKIKLRI